jgi:uncharacterized protein with NAD-binding domain and iron-sulfur cluster
LVSRNENPEVITRRRFVRDAGAASIAAVQLFSAPITSASSRRRARPTVAVFGGGVGGLTAAHELAERGFDVTVYERRAFGGKARSLSVPGSARGGRRPLPGEHGARFIFGGYQNLPDTMRRIPFGTNPNGVADNIVKAPLFDVARDGGRANVSLPAGDLDPRPYTPAQGLETLMGAFDTLPPGETAQFGHRLAVFLSSGMARREGQWEYQSWFDFLQAERFSESYRRLWGDAITKFASASHADTESARCAGEAIESLLYLEITGRTHSRILDLPTNEAWIDPWLALLRSLRVRLVNHHELVRFDVHKGRIVGAQVRSATGLKRVHADWYVCALPVEHARRVWNEVMLAAEPKLAQAASLTTRWMNGIQFYLREPRPITKGIVLYLDSPWGIGSVSQTQFWTDRNFARDYGDGKAQEDLSAFITDATAPGIVFGKTAQECTAQQFAREVWEQMKRHLNDTGEIVLSDDLLHSWHLDPGLVREGDRWHNEDQLWISTPGSLNDLPDAATGIPNFFLASSFVRVDYIDVDCMESANEAGRRAANAILEQAGSRETPAQVFKRQLPAEWGALRALDDQRYRQGQPNLFDTDMTAAELKQKLSDSAPHEVGIRPQHR